MQLPEGPLKVPVVSVDNIEGRCQAESNASSWSEQAQAGNRWKVRKESEKVRQREGSGRGEWFCFSWWFVLADTTVRSQDFISLKINKLWLYDQSILIEIRQSEGWRADKWFWFELEIGRVTPKIILRQIIYYFVSNFICVGSKKGKERIINSASFQTKYRFGQSEKYLFAWSKKEIFLDKNIQKWLFTFENRSTDWRTKSLIAAVFRQPGEALWPGGGQVETGRSWAVWG